MFTVSCWYLKIIHGRAGSKKSVLKKKNTVEKQTIKMAKPKRMLVKYSTDKK